MRRKRVTADELIHLFNERLSENDIRATAHSAIAIVPHAIHGWIAVIPAMSRRNQPAFVKRVERIEMELRQLYLLAD